LDLGDEWLSHRPYNQDVSGASIALLALDELQGENQIYHPVDVHFCCRDLILVTMASDLKKSDSPTVSNPRSAPIPGTVEEGNVVQVGDAELLGRRIQQKKSFHLRRR
jgi:hypothetical protein